MNDLTDELGPLADATGAPPTIDELRARRARRRGRRIAVASASTLSVLLAVVVAGTLASGGSQPSTVLTGQRAGTSTTANATANQGTTRHHVDRTVQGDSRRTTTVPTGDGRHATMTDGDPTSGPTTSTTLVGRLTVPGVPTIGVATVGPTGVGTGFWGTVGTGLYAGKGSALVTWSPPASDGGSPITGYWIQPIDVGGDLTFAGVHAPATATSVVVTGLLAHHPMRFEVFATNAIGDGGASAPSNTITPPETAPNVPVLEIPQVGMPERATAGDGSATMSWDPPYYDGGSPVTGYLVTAVLPDGSAGPTCTAGPTDSSCTVTGLTNGTTYRFRVQATNAIGLGDPSTPTNPVTPSAST
jgi:titin